MIFKHDSNEFSKIKNCNIIYYNQFIKKTASFIVMVNIMIFIPNTRFGIVLIPKKIKK